MFSSGVAEMKSLPLMASFALITLVVYPARSGFQSEEKQTSIGDPKPIVAVVQRTKGRLSIAVHPDPLPGKDPLRVFNALHEKFDSKYPVVAIVDDSARISDLYEVDGTAGKAGFENVRTFISHYDNGKMFEVKFGPGIPFSINGPFNPQSDVCLK